jgi:hypothetical protein
VVISSSFQKDFQQRVSLRCNYLYPTKDVSSLGKNATARTRLTGKHTETPMNIHEKLNYVELPASDLVATKAFFHGVFGWQFQDFGPDYTAFSDQILDGGFYRSENYSRSADKGVLLVFYSDNLEATLMKVERFGGKILKPIFSFPGGRRFHFSEPSGNELAVWSDLDG